ncbi:MAG: tripartite tricarboxylate transporter substrate binding protein [Rubrivivax sp.]
MRRARRALIAAAAALLAAPPAFAQAPTMKLLVGYTAGGPVDAAARQFAPALAKELEWNVVVENRPGANATLAGDLVSKAAPDGLTIWFAASPPLTISPHIMKKMAFDPAKDLAAVAPVLAYYNVLVVARDSPHKSVQDLIAWGKANPGKVFYGSAGIGASNHLSGELFALQVGAQFSHVPYKGNAPSMTDVIGGQLTMMFDIIGGARPHINGGRVRALAVTSPQRNPVLPDVPTMAESGLPGFDVGGFFGLYGPPKLGADLVKKINEATRRALLNPELQKAWGEQGYVVWSGSPEQLAQRAAAERAMWGPVTKGISVD